MDDCETDEKLYDLILKVSGIQFIQCELNKKYLVYKLLEVLDMKDLWNDLEEAQKKKFNNDDHNEKWRKIYDQFTKEQKLPPIAIVEPIHSNNEIIRKNKETSNASPEVIDTKVNPTPQQLIRRRTKTPLLLLENSR